MVRLLGINTSQWGLGLRCRSGPVRNLASQYRCSTEFTSSMAGLLACLATTLTWNGTPWSPMQLMISKAHRLILTSLTRLDKAPPAVLPVAHHPLDVASVLV